MVGDDKRQVLVVPDVAAVVQRALEQLLTVATAAIAQRGRFTLALAGGSTPKPLYQAIAQQALPWDAVHVFWGDERYVPPTHPDSNEGMARHAWLDQVPIPAANIHPMPTDEADPAIAAQRYETHLHQFFGTTPGQVPALDVILLGMGDDGHTASLFPQTPALAVRDRLVTVGHKEGQPRLTLTVPCLNQARHIIFLVAGEKKQTALQHVFAAEDDANTYPARLIHPQGSLIWILDEAAGRSLNPSK